MRIMQQIKIKMAKIIYRKPYPPCKRETKLFMNYILSKYPQIRINLVDIGCRGGVSHIYKRISNFKPNVFIRGVESHRPEFERLQNTGEFNSIKNIALSDVEKKAKLYITESSGASSLYEPNNDELQYYSFNKWFKVKKIENIFTKRLDDIFEKIDYLHLDCQASEYDVLKGGIKNMANIIGIDFEANLFPYYKKQKLFPELHNFMLENKFRCIKLDTRSNDGEICELGNCVYIKEHKSIKEKENLIKNILFALLWDRKQYVEFLIRNYGFILGNEREYIIKLLGIIPIKNQEPID